MYKLCAKVISTKFVLANISQVNNKESTQNHSSGINMRQTHSIT